MEGIKIFKILNYEEREALKNHQNCDGGEFPNFCDEYFTAIWHRQLDNIYGKPPKWSEKLRNDIHYETYVSDDVRPTFEEYKKEILQGKETSYMAEYEGKYCDKLLRKKYVVMDKKILPESQI